MPKRGPWCKPIWHVGGAMMAHRGDAGSLAAGRALH